MENNVNRNHWTYMIKSLIKMIKGNFFIFILLMVNKTGIYYIGAIVILMIITSILQWRKTTFHISDDLLIHEKGVISKSKEEIPFNKINTIDVGQSILDRMFNVSTMKIDTGSAVAEKSELQIIADDEDIKELREIILGSKKVETSQGDEAVENGAASSEVEKVITIGETIKYALTKSKLGWAIGGFFVLHNSLDDIGNLLGISFSKYVSFNSNADSIKAESIASIIMILIGLALLLYVLITIASIIFEAVRLHNFTVKADEEKISVSYGLLSKKQYSFSMDKIYGLRYRQSMLQQILNIHTVELISIGYGDEKNESALLYPIADDDFKNEFIKKLLPDMTFEGEVNKPPKSSLKRFVLAKFIMYSIILIPSCMFIKFIPQNIKLAAVMLVSSYCLISGCLNYKNTSLGVSQKALMASAGAFSKVTTIIGQDTLQSITKKQGIFQKRGKVCDYKIDLYSNKLGDVVHVRNMSEDMFAELQQNLIL